MLFKHRLREVRDLCHYRVTGAGISPAVLSGLIVDAGDWHVDAFVVLREEPARELFVVPTSCFASLDDEARTLSLNVPDEILHTPDARKVPDLHGSSRFDAVKLPGETMFGCDEAAGTIIDLLVNVELWQLRYFIVQADSAVVLTDIEWASSLTRGSDQVIVDLPAVAIATAPPYESISNLCSGAEEALYRHYTRNEFVSLDAAARGVGER